MSHSIDFKKFKAVFFDWDNTLVDTWPALLNASNTVLKHFGESEIDIEEVKIRARLSTRESFPKLFGEEWKKAQEIFYKAIDANRNSIKLIDGASSFVEELKNSGKIIAIISNKRNDRLRSEVERFNIFSDLILGSGDTAFDKPHPEMGLIALKHFELQPDEVVYIGDSITDWTFAKNLNMPAIAIGNDAYDGPLLARFNSLNKSLIL